MEDADINGGDMLSAIILRYKATGEAGMKLGKLLADDSCESEVS